jgi:glycosyltransferase involved in cell wall biosynthesis
VSARIPFIGRLHKRASVATWRLYGLRTAWKLRRAEGAKVFHYRAGFGGASVERARKLGMIALCDHALVHPSVLDALIEHRGVLDAAVGSGNAVGRTLDLEARVALEDIERADAVIVNSDFVKETFLRLGWPSERLRVAYLGVDNNFFETGPAVQRRETQTGPLPLLFASRFERRKGAELLIEALSKIGARIDWDLVVAGPVSPEISSAHPAFFADERVRVLGPLTRAEFKRQMIERPVFVFPTFAEGSARAVFDALACGCYCITTPNAGSVVEDGVHGALIPPGDGDALAAAIIAADQDRELIAEIGNRNIERVATKHRQEQYGDALAVIYRELAR